MIRHTYFYFQKNGMAALISKIRQKFSERYNLDYTSWELEHRSSERELHRQRAVEFSYSPLISVVVPVYRTPEKFLRAMIESVQNQTYTRWELCIADGSGEGETSHVLTEYEKDSRIHIRQLEMNMGIAGNTNEALGMAVGDYVALLDHDDLLTADALYHVVSFLQNHGNSVDFLYSDEDKTDDSGQRFFEPHFKPGFSMALLRSSNYICHLSIVRRNFLLEKGIVFNSGYDGAQDYDFILRCAESAKSILHIPKVLYHWRTHDASTAGAGGGAKPYTHEAGRRALEAHLERMAIQGIVEDSKGATSNFYRIRYHTKAEKISVLLLGSGADVEEASLSGRIKACTDYDDYEVICGDSFGKALERAAGKWIVVLNSQAVPQDRLWLWTLLGDGLNEGADIVGGKLIGERNKLRPIGWLRNQGGFLECYSGLDVHNTGYVRRLFARQELSAVNPHMMFFQRDLYERIAPEPLAEHWLEEVLVFCFHTSGTGKRVVFDPEVTVYLPDSARHMMGDISVNLETDSFGNPNYIFFKMYFSQCASLGKRII